MSAKEAVIYPPNPAKTFPKINPALSKPRALPLPPPALVPVTTQPNTTPPPAVQPPPQAPVPFPAPPSGPSISVPNVSAPIAPAKPVIITNGPPKPAETLMKLSFDLQNNGGLQGSVLRGKGFRIFADAQSGASGTMRLLFQQMYRGMPINEWSGGTGFPNPFEGSVAVDLPPGDGGTLQFSCTYDLHTLEFSLSSAAGVLTNCVLWRDNMTDALGPDGPDTLTVDHPAVSNVAFTPAEAIAPSRYVWEGVIGNTSRDPVGSTVHSPWWPVAKMASRGTNVFYTGGYNESKWDLQKFHTSDPQTVVTNFSANGRKQTLGMPWVIDLNYQDDNTLLVKYSDGNIVAFDPATCTKLAEHLPDWAPPAVLVPTADSSAVAVNPTDSSIVAVFYHTTDQVVVYGNANIPGAFTTNFVIGAAGGYANGPSVLVPTNTPEFSSYVKLSGYYFDGDGTTNADTRITNAVLCFQSDGKLWIGDTLSSRMLRFDTAGLCDAWFMFVAHTYNAYVDPNDPQRVFTGYLEFEVDYTNAISNCWTLKNCWTRYDDGTELERANLTQNGLFSVVTLTNSGAPRTMALARDPLQHNRRQMVELTPRGIRRTYIRDQSPVIELDPDGSTMTMSVGPTPQTGNKAHFFRDSISGWYGSDPVYSRTDMGIVDYVDNVTPIYWGAAKLRGSKLFLFYPSKTQFEREDPATPYTGSHIGAVDFALGGSWAWLNAPTGPLDGRGTFETNCNYAGSGFTVIDDDIFFFYRGEAWRGGQANQIFHYKTDGTFVGQFGTPSFIQGTILNAPGAGANAFNISATKVNGTIYLYTSDEWSHGVHRWRIDP